MAEEPAARAFSLGLGFKASGGRLLCKFEGLGFSLRGLKVWMLEFRRFGGTSGAENLRFCALFLTVLVSGSKQRLLSGGAAKREGRT